LSRLGAFVYADYLEHEAVSLRRYIDWQKNRVSAWKAAELLPVDAKTKKALYQQKRHISWPLDF
jgi:hypothetical protein